MIAKCEHVFVPSVDPLTRAIRARDVEAMILAAQALRPVGLEEALAIVVVLADVRDPRFLRWGEHWVRRVAGERRLQRDTVEHLRRLLRQLPHQNEARGVEVALRSYARTPRTWS
ncbi:hypothetical protein VSS74_16390 [Conexibacter stalactiti]|uniref:Uncharacterized protein n=1 Tax=Conexibacter stalactiti TaxID=1940611 RepID=A0ABU4HRW0_9ACTN|nr:hypothetical protein [Conexibacter stalactiti]MDW5595929.1 hypothetical protein [Conexibacter stalactiti]MEC5036571.1 hypothetical protein [Conexibacter stalactiti]